MKKKKKNKVTAIYHFKGLIQQDKTLIIHFSKVGSPQHDCTYSESLFCAKGCETFISFVSCFDEDTKTLVYFDPIAYYKDLSSAGIKRQKITLNPFYPLVEVGAIDLQHFCQDLLQEDFEENFSYESQCFFGEGKYKRKSYSIDVTATFTLQKGKPIITKLMIELYNLPYNKNETIQIDLTPTKYFSFVQKQGYKTIEIAIQTAIELYLANSNC